MAGNGDSSESSENGELVCDVSNGECSASLGEDKIAALKEKNREKLALKKLSVFDEELLRLVGQHLGKLGFRYCNFVVNFFSCFEFFLKVGFVAMSSSIIFSLAQCNKSRRKKAKFLSVERVV